MGIITVIIGIFFAFTGGYAIIESLSKLGLHKSDSVIQTGWFKLNAPIGFIYGIIAIGIVFALIKYHDYGDQSGEIKKLKSVISELQNKDLNNPETLDFVKFRIARNEPKSIFRGKILINHDYEGIEFAGSLGLSLEQTGKFENAIFKIKDGMKFYFMTRDSIVFGVNIIDASYDVQLEIYKD